MKQSVALGWVWGTDNEDDDCQKDVDDVDMCKCVTYVKVNLSCVSRPSSVPGKLTNGVAQTRDDVYVAMTQT